MMRNPQIGDLVFARVDGDYQSEARIGVLVEIDKESAWLYGHNGSYRCIANGMISVPKILWTNQDKRLILEVKHGVKLLSKNTKTSH